jgi:hypothetical protein
MRVKPPAKNGILNLVLNLLNLVRPRLDFEVGQAFHITKSPEITKLDHGFSLERKPMA